MQQEVLKIRQNLISTHDRQKSYAYLKMRNTKYSIGDHVYLWVKPKISSLKLGNYSKLAPRYCEPFNDLERIDPIAYKLALLAKFRVHDVFHVPLLKKYVVDPKHVIA